MNAAWSLFQVSVNPQWDCSLVVQALQGDDEKLRQSNPSSADWEPLTRKAVKFLFHPVGGAGAPGMV